MSTQALLLQTHDLSIGYPHKPIATNLNLTLYQGELVCLVGPNGAGKSTLLRTLAGMQKPRSGNVTLAGQNISAMSAIERAKRLSVVLTHRLDVGLLSGYNLVALGRHPHTQWTGRLSRRDEAVIHWAIQAVGATELAKRTITELSDGERQKIMIARALAQEPLLMILDEPTAFLDLPRRAEIMQLLRRLAHTTHRTILLSSHDLDLALHSADALWVLDAAGHLRTGTPEDLVLQGVIEQVFASEGVHFDVLKGAFQFQNEAQNAIVLLGDGVRYEWTRRALERIGFWVQSDMPPNETALPIIEVHPTSWILKFDTTIFHGNTIAELLIGLQKRYTFSC